MGMKLVGPCMHETMDEPARWAVDGPSAGKVAVVMGVQQERAEGPTERRTAHIEWAVKST